MRTAEESERALFSTLVAEHQDYLYSFVLGMIGRLDDAQDLTAKTFLKGFLAFKTFNHNCSFKTWITTVAINLIKNYRRDKRELSSLDAAMEEVGFDPVDTSATPDEATVICENKNAIFHALQKLPTKYRVFIVMKYLQDLSYEEIAENTGVPVTTVRNRIHHGKEALKDLFKSEGVTPPMEEGYGTI